MAEKRSIPAREALADIRVGMTDDQLMVKYSLTDKGLQSLKNKLLAAGLVAPAQLDNSQSIEVPQENDTKVLARKIAEAVKAGRPDEEIAKTFGLLPDKLSKVFPLLIKNGYLTQEDYDRRQSRLEEVIDMELDFSPQTENVDTEVCASAFAVIRGRTLLASLVLAPILAFTVSGIIWAVWEIKLESPLGTALSTVLDQVFLFLCMAYLLRLAKLSPGELLGHNAAWPLLGRSMLVAFPLIALAIAGNYLLYLPLSYLVPRFVDWCLFCRPPMIVLTTDYAGMSANLLNFFVIVLMAPVVEEFFFRGLLLTRWSFKWNVRTGIFASSLVFALGHPDNVVGAFFIGYVLSILYIQTNSLFVPISIHIANNGIAWILTGVNTIFGEPYARSTLAEWQSFWWVGLVAGLIVAPWVIRFLRHHIPKPDWRVPYLALQETT
jgi:uncharacterized protein